MAAHAHTKGVVGVPCCRWCNDRTDAAVIQERESVIREIELLGSEMRRDCAYVSALLDTLRLLRQAQRRMRRMAQGSK